MTFDRIAEITKEHTTNPVGRYRGCYFSVSNEGAARICAQWPTVNDSATPVFLRMQQSAMHLFTNIPIIINDLMVGGQWELRSFADLDIRETGYLGVLDAGNLDVSQAE